MKKFRSTRIWALILTVVMIISLLPATLAQAALYEGLQEQDGKLTYVKELPTVPTGDVSISSTNSSGKTNTYSTTYTVEDEKVIVLDALDQAMNQTRDWIGAAECKFIITDKLTVVSGKEVTYLDGETPIEPLKSTDESIDHTGTLAADAKAVVPGDYTYRENARGTVWTITLGELVKPEDIIQSGITVVEINGTKYQLVDNKTAIVEYEGEEGGTFGTGKYLVVNGIVDTTANGLVEDPGASGKTKPKYYFENGKLHSNEVEIYNGYYLSYGKFNESFTGFVTYKEDTYYVVNGIVSTEEPAAVEDPAAPGTFYYVKDGKVDTTFNDTFDEHTFTEGKCVESTETPHVVITCSDRHDNTETLQNILKAMPTEPAPEAAIHNGDAVNSGTFKFADINEEFAEVFPSLKDKVFYSYGSHDSAAEEYDDVEPEGVMYQTEDYIFYDISMNTMQDAEKAETAAAAFTEKAASFDTNKVLFVASHMPLHTRRGDNLGAATWFAAINKVAKNMDTIVLWSHNHTGETNDDTQNYLRMPGESMTPQGGKKGSANFIYANAGYIIVGYMTQWTITDSTIKIQRYDADGAVDFHDGITYPVVFNRNTKTLVAGDINHDEAGDGESTGGSGGGSGGGGGGSNTTAYYTTSEAEAAKKAANAKAGAYVFEEPKGSMGTFTWTITLKEDGTYDIEEVRGSYGTSNFTGTKWTPEGNFVTLGTHSADSIKGGWCNPAGFYIIVDPDTMTFRPSLTPEGNPDEETDEPEEPETPADPEPAKEDTPAEPAKEDTPAEPEVVPTSELPYDESFDKTGIFADVKDAKEPFYKPVYWAVENGIVKGYKNGYFGPSDSCTREQFLIMIWRYAGKPTAKADVKFSDIDSSRSSYKAIQWAVEEGIIKGFDDGTFRPEGTTTRRQVAVMLWRMNGKQTATKTTNFSDVKASESTYKAIQWGAEAGLIKGYADGTFKPEDDCLRMHIAIFLYRYARDVDGEDVSR